MRLTSIQGGRVLCIIRSGELAGWGPVPWDRTANRKIPRFLPRLRNDRSLQDG